MEIKFSLAKNKDVQNLLDYFKKNDPNFEESFVKKRIKYYINNHFIILAKENKKITGHLFFQAKEIPKLGVGEFEAVNIHPNYRGQGIGSQLIEKAIEHAKKYFKHKGIKLRCLYLFTRSNNDMAKHIYGKAGFKPGNTIGKIFRDDEPEEMIMTRFF